MQNKLLLNEIGADFREYVTTQQYGKKTGINDVKLIELKVLQDDGGAFTELIRCDENGNLLAIPEFKIRQSNFSTVLPGAIKAWHLHFNQEDVWFVPPNARLLVGLLDVREGSGTYRNQMRFVMGGGKAQLLYIPRGVAHGAANIWNQESFMIYFVNQHFNADEPDENRLPWDVIGKEIWEIQQG